MSRDRRPTVMFPASLCSRPPHWETSERKWFINDGLLSFWSPVWPTFAEATFENGNQSFRLFAAPFYLTRRVECVGQRFLCRTTVSTSTKIWRKGKAAILYRFYLGQLIVRKKSQRFARIPNIVSCPTSVAVAMVIRVTKWNIMI